jgi:hypothetical protein
MNTLEHTKHRYIVNGGDIEMTDRTVARDDHYPRSHICHQSVLAIIPAEKVELRMNISKPTFHRGDNSKGDD